MAFEDFNKLRHSTERSIEKSMKNINELVKLSDTFNHIDNLDNKYAEIYDHLYNALRILSYTNILKNEVIINE